MKGRFIVEAISLDSSAFSSVLCFVTVVTSRPKGV